MKALAIAVGLVLTFVAGTPLAAEDFTGKWSGTFAATGPDGASHDDSVFMDLKHNGKTLTGTAGPAAEMQYPLSNGKVDGNTLSFSVQTDGPLITFALTYTAGHLKGSAAAEFGGQKIAAKVDAQRKTGF